MCSSHRLGARARKFLGWLVVVSFLTGFAWTMALAQGFPSQRREPDPMEEQRRQIEKDMAKKANRQRQAELQRDADKLLRLATELKHYVDKSNENVLSLEVIRKAEEIEKLAHSVKGKMKGY